MMIPYRIYQILIALPLLLVATILASITTIIAVFLGIKAGTYYPAHIWAKLWCWLNFVRVTVKGHQNVDKKTSYVFVANHQGAFDIFSIYGFLGHDFKWMMKISLRKIPLVGYTCYRAGHIFVDRSSASAVRRTMEEAEKRLKGGASLVVFPEGARTWDGHMRQFKKGAFQLAMEFNLPLVPVTVDGSFDVMPRTARLPRPGHITLTIHHPIAPSSSAEERNEAMEHTARTIREALPERYR